MKVQFNEVEEFMEELDKDKTKIDRGIIRTTIRYVNTTGSPNIKSVIACSTYSVEGQVIELNEYCGDVWGLNNELDKAVVNIAEKFMTLIEETATEYGLDLRHGILEDNR